MRTTLAAGAVVTTRTLHYSALVRRGVAATALAATTCVAPSPAVAAAALVLRCEVTYTAYGVGASDGTGDCVASGTYNGSAYLRFDVDMAAGLCPAQEVADGTMTMGAWTTSFTWTRYGHTGTVQTATPPMRGTATFFVTSPVGNPCGAAGVRATVILVFCAL